MSENIELGLELKTVMLERDKLKLEVDRVGIQGIWRLWSTIWQVIGSNQFGKWLVQTMTKV